MVLFWSGERYFSVLMVLFLITLKRKPNNSFSIVILLSQRRQGFFFLNSSIKLKGTGISE